MKKLLIVALVIGLIGAWTGVAQEAVETDPVELKAQMAALQAKLTAVTQAEEARKATPIGKIEGIGKEIGVGLKGLVGAIDDTAEVSIKRVNEFVETDAGKMTAFMIAWKVMADDIGAVALAGVQVCHRLERPGQGLVRDDQHAVGHQQPRFERFTDGSASIRRRTAPRAGHHCFLQ